MVLVDGMAFFIRDDSESVSIALMANEFCCLICIDIGNISNVTQDLLHEDFVWNGGVGIDAGDLA